MNSNLKSLALSLEALKESSQTNPLEYARFTPPQIKFLSCKDKFFCLRGGNQIGKSYAGAAEVIYRAIGNHPYKKVPVPPVEIWVVCHSWSQSIVMQSRLWELLPKNELNESVQYDPAKGFKGTTPVITFKNGSIIRIKTTNQARGSKGTISLAGGTIDFVLIDEPPPPGILNELMARILRRRGSMAITFTPVGVPCDHLKKLCDDGIMTDIHAPLTVENLTPDECKPLITKEEVETIEKSYLKMDRAVRMEGAWEGYTPMGVIFADFREEFISPERPPRGNYQFSIGIDHGSSEGAQVAVLIGVKIPDMNIKQGKNNDYYLYVMDEYVSSAAKSEIHARGILQMIKRNNLEIKDIHRWTGDRPHRGDRYGSRMSNKMLRAAFAHILGYPRGGGFHIHTAYKPSFSVYYGCRVLQELMAKGQFQINPRCNTTIKSLKNWAILKSGRLDVNSQHKHAIDALRYCALSALDKKYRVPMKTHIKIVR